MKVSNLKPHAHVADYVERILVIENCLVTTPFVLPLFANGNPTLLFQTSKGAIKNRSTANLTLFGQTVFPETLIIKEDFTLIAYFFKPFTLHSLFGVCAKELTDFPIDLNLLSPDKTKELQEQLLNSETANEMITLLNAYVLSLAVKTKMGNQIVQYATKLIANNASKDALVLVQNELHVTERTFQRMFEKNIGISPNLYRRICQFNTAFQQLNARRFTKLTDLAFENGYADQSHYIRAFREFTNITPKEYLKFGAAD